ncbi:MAG TPA: single-stranded DNA-binding protein [Candidatus Limnocylindria bacterium]|nr:single-stranded DNA-binding protein [Candidatus Limnocylindria bacterium]
MTLNKMMIIGNLGADPELRYTPSGKAVTNLRVAVNDRSRGSDGEWVEETMWIGVEVWEQQAERLAEQLRKGNKIYAEGQLRAREYEARDGQKRTALELRFARVVNLERRPREEGDGGGYGGGSYSDAPPAVKPRGAEQRSSSPGAEMDVDDIPF